MLCMCNINIDFTSELQGIKNWEGPGNKGTLLEIKNEVIFFFFVTEKWDILGHPH